MSNTKPSEPKAAAPTAPTTTTTAPVAPAPPTAVAAAAAAAAAAASPPNKNAPPPSNEELLQSTLYRLTNGLPHRELSLMVTEMEECEASLQKEIALMEKALKGNLSTQETTEMEITLQSTLTPLDRYWTASALLGRLRDEWTLPSILVALDGGKDDTLTATPPDCPSARQAASAAAQPRFTTAKGNTVQSLLAVWKKIATHKTALVFKRPVKPEEAPGYTDRISFPMDLSMVRKWIVAQKIVSLEQLQAYIGLIAHNCVKYNGRESDYGRVAREFEAAAEEIIRLAVLQQQLLLPPQPVAAATTSTANNKSTPPVKALATEGRTK